MKHMPPFVNATFSKLTNDKDEVLHAKIEFFRNH